MPRSRKDRWRGQLRGGRGGLLRVQIQGRESQAKRCAALTAKIDEFALRCSDHFGNPHARVRDFREDPKMYYNTAINYCHFTRFQIFVRELKLIGMDFCPKQKPRCVPATYRSAFQMIDFLGELIAAQNYIDGAFVPVVLYGHSTERPGVPRSTAVRRPSGRRRESCGVRHTRRRPVLHPAARFWFADGGAVNAAARSCAANCACRHASKSKGCSQGVDHRGRQAVTGNGALTPPPHRPAARPSP